MILLKIKGAVKNRRNVKIDVNDLGFFKNNSNVVFVENNARVNQQ